MQRARETFFTITDRPGEIRRIREGQLIADDDPAVGRAPDLFDEVSGGASNAELLERIARLESLLMAQAGGGEAGGGRRPAASGKKGGAT